MRTALFPGTFDPFTLGHASIVERGLVLFDRIVIAIGINAEKKTYFTLQERLEQIKACYADNDRVEVCAYEGLTVELAQEKGAGFILRGVRSITDFEYERQLSDIYRRLSNIETVSLFTEPSLSYIQSSMVRDLLRYHKDISAFVPEAIYKQIKR
jgi:pantetheine-phosphate adenylyltransferase